MRANAACIVYVRSLQYIPHREALGMCVCVSVPTYACIEAKAWLNYTVQYASRLSLDGGVCSGFVIWTLGLRDLHFVSKVVNKFTVKQTS